LLVQVEQVHQVVGQALRLLTLQFHIFHQQQEGLLDIQFQHQEDRGELIKQHHQPLKQGMLEVIVLQKDTHQEYLEAQMRLQELEAEVEQVEQEQMVILTLDLVHLGLEELEQLYH
tara:strand:+ start:150 stop:497 length:348 start_codon:yes stop_codon:yes gene_type:complete